MVFLLSLKAFQTTETGQEVTELSRGHLIKTLLFKEENKGQVSGSYRRYSF